MPKPTTPTPERYLALAQMAEDLFQANGISWVDAPRDDPHQTRGWLLASNIGGAPDPIQAITCHVTPHTNGGVHALIWASDPKDPKTTAGACALLIFGHYEALLTQSGHPIILEISEEIRNAFTPYYEEIPLFQAIDTCLVEGSAEIQKKLDRFESIRGQEDWEELWEDWQEEEGLGSSVESLDDDDQEGEEWKASD